MEHPQTATAEAGSDYIDIKYDDEDDYHQDEDAQISMHKVVEHDLNIFVPHTYRQVAPTHKNDTYEEYKEAYVGEGQIGEDFKDDEDLVTENYKEVVSILVEM